MQKNQLPCPQNSKHLSFLALLTVFIVRSCILHQLTLEGYLEQFIFFLELTGWKRCSVNATRCAKEAAGFLYVYMTIAIFVFSGIWWSHRRTWHVERGFLQRQHPDHATTKGQPDRELFFFPPPDLMQVFYSKQTIMSPCLFPAVDIRKPGRWGRDRRRGKLMELHC